MSSHKLLLPNEVAVTIQRRLDEVGLEHRALARERIGVSEQTLNHWLEGSLKIGTHNLNTLMMHLGLGISNLFEELPEYYQNKSILTKVLPIYRQTLLRDNLPDVVAKYQKFILRLIDNIDFSPVPQTSPFTLIGSDNKYSSRYAHIRLTKKEPIEGKFILSQQLFGAIRVYLGELRVTGHTARFVPYLQQRAASEVSFSSDYEYIDIALWFSDSSNIFFIESTEGGALSSQAIACHSEGEHLAKEQELLTLLYRPVYADFLL